MAKVIDSTDPHAAWATMAPRKLLNVGLYGLLVGAVTYSLFLLLDRFVFSPILCQESVALARCETKDAFSGGVAILLGSMLGLILLVRERVYRPILALLGVGASLWGLFGIISALPWIASMIIAAVAFGIAYALFSWLVQPTSLVISLVAVTVAAVVARLSLNL